MADTKFTSLRTTGALTVGGVLTIVGALAGAALSGTSFTAPTGSDVVVNAPSGQDIVFQLNGTEIRRETSVACTATGGNVKTGAGGIGGAKYDTCYMASPLSTTGSLQDVSIQCGSVAVELVGDLGFVKSASAGTGTALPNFSNKKIGTGAYAYLHTGAVLWNPADKLKFGTLTPLTGTLNTTRYDCVMRTVVEDLYGR